jgi:ComF family protein
VSFADSARDLFFPSRCLHCGLSLGVAGRLRLCSDCLSLVAPLVHPLCVCCGTPFSGGTDHLCGECLNSRFAFDRARSLFYHREPVSSLIVNLKFNCSLTGLTTLASLCSRTLPAASLNRPDIILPVPLHVSRLRERGFNQSLLLAKSCLPPEWRKYIRCGLLKRIQATAPQTSLSGRTRRTNLARAFSLADGQQVTGRRILLFDDVFTTGATLHECAKVLIRAGAAEVEALTLTRAV